MKKVGAHFKHFVHITSKENCDENVNVGSLRALDNESQTSFPENKIATVFRMVVIMCYLYYISAVYQTIVKYHLYKIYLMCTN